MYSKNSSLLLSKFVSTSREFSKDTYEMLANENMLSDNINIRVYNLFQFTYVPSSSQTPVTKGTFSKISFSLIFLQ